MPPTYLYTCLNAEGVSEPFEIEHAMALAPLSHHPETGQPLQRYYKEAPGILTQYSERSTQARLSTKNIEKAGFTKYIRDKASGQYHRIAEATGAAGAQTPETLKNPHL